MDNSINSQQLANFLTEAHKNSYANKDAPKASSSRLKSEDYHFEKGNLIYHDTYFGSRDFIGEEVVYKDGNPVWGMNFYGYILSETTDGEELYDFLREAMMQEYSNTLPVRGPQDYKKDNWEYTKSVEGELNRFTGTEEIYRAGMLLYRGYYHGGLIY